MKVVTVKYYGYEDIASKLWDVLETYSSSHRLPLDDSKFDAYIRNKVTRKFARYTPVDGCYINKYLDQASKDINDWNGSYDEALQFTNGVFGYDSDTGKWSNPSVWDIVMLVIRSMGEEDEDRMVSMTTMIYERLAHTDWSIQDIKDAYNEGLEELV